MAAGGAAERAAGGAVTGRTGAPGDAGEGEAGEGGAGVSARAGTGGWGTTTGRFGSGGRVGAPFAKARVGAGGVAAAGRTGWGGRGDATGPAGGEEGREPTASAGGGTSAFFTDKIVLAAGWGVAEPWPWIKALMRMASSSLIELLWLRAAMDNFSAASSTSLLSRPRSRDSS